ncbi:MAG TPA: hypothetical protein GX693_00310 [Firmicutes bacterium]|nr:hypothetical protein [Bacillota bacterium]
MGIPWSSISLFEPVIEHYQALDEIPEYEEHEFLHTGPWEEAGEEDKEERDEEKGALAQNPWMEYIDHCSPGL